MLGSENKTSHNCNQQRKGFVAVVDNPLALFSACCPANQMSIHISRPNFHETPSTDHTMPSGAISCSSHTRKDCPRFLPPALPCARYQNPGFNESPLPQLLGTGNGRIHFYLQPPYPTQHVPDRDQVRPHHPSTHHTTPKTTLLIWLDVVGPTALLLPI